AKAFQDLLNFPIKVNDKLGNLGWSVQMSDGAPNKQALDVYNYLAKKADEQFESLKQVIDSEVAAFNRLIHELAVPAVILKHIKKEK
ncbi:MAG: hypothetical protein KAT34_19615, partial [Candidatus Aminicenantes bacterium]|nr:hypothetical protein [Candidatus Aminicenantes bacterium]